jgi:branched-chain amino acid transport system substrate-binding protein
MPLRISRTLATLLALSFLTAACAPAPAASPSAGGAPAQPANGAPAGGTFAFGVLLPLTGPAAAIGTVNRNGLEMAVEEINQQGGAAGLKFEANVQDHKGTAQDGVAAMNQLVNISHVPAVISTFSGPTLAAQPIAAQNKVLLVNTGGTDVSLLNKPWLYNNQVMAPNLVPALARYSWDQGFRKAAALSSNDAYGDGSRKSFQDAWQKVGGGQLVADELFPLDATDFSAQLTKIKAANPDVLMVVAVGQTQGQIIKQARALGVTAQMLGPLATNDILGVGGPAADGFIDSGIAVDPKAQDPGARRFIETYQQKYGSQPDWPSGTMYETVYLLRDLVNTVSKQGGDPRDGDQLLKALEANPRFHNYLADGDVQFGPDHSVLRKLALRKVTAGAFQPFSIVDPQ